MAIDWSKHIQIDTTWVDAHLTNQLHHLKSKVIIRGYTIKASGTTISAQALAEKLSLMLPEYVFSKEKIAEHGERAALSLAQKYFGKRDPDAEGKFGELLLFALAESILGCKMVALKIRSLSNFSDQVKGGDGIFLGSYLTSDGANSPACFIGESKVVAKYSSGLDEAFESINRFHDETLTAQFSNTEYLVAKENVVFDDTTDLDEVYARLSPSEDIFKDQVIVHPVLLMYNAASVKKLERKSANRDHLEDLLKTEFSRKISVYEKSIATKLERFPGIQRVYLDFFIIPTNSVDEFRNQLYYQIHGVPFAANNT